MPRTCRCLCSALVLLVAAPGMAAAEETPKAATVPIREQAVRQALTLEALGQLNQAPRQQRGRRIRGGVPIFIGGGVGCGLGAALGAQLGREYRESVSAGAKMCLGAGVVGMGIGYIVAAR